MRDIALYDYDALSRSERAKLCLRAEDDLSDYIEKVTPVIEAVRQEGDAAIARFIKQFDGADVDPAALLATEAEFEAAFETLDDEFIEVLRDAADNIRRFHEMQKPQDIWWTEIRDGVKVGERATPLQSVALYSPRGKGSFPSVTLMTAIPAVVAGVIEPIILTPPGPDGEIDPATLVAARLAGVKKVARAGGPLAVAAAAFGTQSIPKCLKIEGPGSPWFVAAKKVLADEIGSRLPAGPSEVIVLADESVSPRLAALDILIESEHGADSSGFLVTWSKELAEEARKAIPTFYEQMSEERVDYASAVLAGPRGGIVLTKDKEQAYQFINDYAPEHCQILSKDAEAHLPHILHASEVLLGEYAAGSLANYMMGPNCVLPTSAAAHIHSPLGVMDFMKMSSVGMVNKQGFAEMGPKTEIFARYEGFDAHANAVSSLRQKILDEDG
jgi:histidinol dehydrogenase